MLLTNKKFVIGLVVLTLLGAFVFSQKHKAQNIMSEKELIDFSTDFNKNLPLKINDDISLIKTQVNNISHRISLLDFYYAYYHNKNDIKNFDDFSQSMIFQTCQNDTTLELLKRGILIRHQFVTLDKEKLPYIGVSLEECVNILKAENKKAALNINNNPEPKK